MPVTVTKTVKSTGGDYTSLSAWEAAQQGDLVALDEIHKAECYAFDDTTDVTIDGSTTDDTRYMEVVVAAGEGHTGVFSTSKYRLTGGTFGSIKLTISDRGTRITGLQVNHTAGGSAAQNINITVSTVVVSRCILKGAFTGINANGATGKLRNLVVYDATGVGIQIRVVTSTAENCTVVDSVKGFQNYFSGGAVTIKNCLAKGNSTTDFIVEGGGTSFTATYCASGDATADDWAGTGNRISQTFTFTNEAGDNFELASSDAGAKGFGTDLSATFTDDIAGSTRTVPWDIGAWKAVAAAAAFPSAILNNPLFSLVLVPVLWRWKRFQNKLARGAGCLMGRY